MICRREAIRQCTGPLGVPGLDVFLGIEPWLVGVGPFSMEWGYCRSLPGCGGGAEREEMPVQGLAIGHYWRGKFIDPLSEIQRGGLHRERKITVNF